MKLVIGNKNYSSWSLRPWLLLSAFNVEFAEIQESLVQEGIKERFAKYSPSCKVPVLLDGDLNIWDSLAICEYISEKYLQGKGWPEDIKRRAEARAICAEMHSGFMGLRNEMPMNCRASRKLEISTAATADISRIDAIWSFYTEQNSSLGPWLFGKFSIADCFFAPVAFRFSTYGASLSETAQKYLSLLLTHKNVVEWKEAAKAETEIIPRDEAGTSN
ncbi:MAG: glutathione S-transferase family protein [Desulfuromusa sp.]|nr:glutathione S-transferase family protein [Desulfuromusa sp.]